MHARTGVQTAQHVAALRWRLGCVRTCLPCQHAACFQFCTLLSAIVSYKVLITVMTVQHIQHCLKDVAPLRRSCICKVKPSVQSSAKS